MAEKTGYSMVTPSDCAVALIDYQPAMFSGVHSPYGIEVRFVKEFLGGHGEGEKLARAA